MIGTILAGGENKRIPLLKGHIEINGQRIIDSTIRVLKNFFDRVVISTNSPEYYFYCGVPMIGDIVMQRGPLTGIYSVLLNTGDDIFVVGCDMPFIKAELIEYMLSRYSSQNTEHRTQKSNPPLPPFSKGGRRGITNSTLKKWDAVVPIFEKMPQPLLGIYSKNVIYIVEKRLDKGLKGMRDMLTGLDVLYIKEKEVRGIDPEGRSFVNINTMEDYKKAVGVSI